MNAVELRLPDGRLVGYACSHCGQPTTGLMCRDRAVELESSRQAANECCLCDHCGAVMPPDRSRWHVTCEACEHARHEQRRQRDADPAVIAAREATWAARQAVIDGPCPDAEARLRALILADDLEWADLAACRAGADALAELAAQTAAKTWRPT